MPAGSDMVRLSFEGVLWLLGMHNSWSFAKDVWMYGIGQQGLRVGIDEDSSQIRRIVRKVD